MYACAWIFVTAPINVSFSTSDPRPITTSSPTTQRSRTHAWSPTITRAPTRVPAKTTAPVDTIVPGPSSAGGSGSREAVERGESAGCLPTTAYSSTCTPSPSTVPGSTIAVGWMSATERVRQPLEGAHDHRAVARHLLAVAVPVEEREEVAALEAQRLVRRHFRDPDVAASRLPLAVGLDLLPRRLLVHRHLPLELHVVEDGHFLAPDDGDPPHLVRVEPRQVHVRDLPGGEAEVAEDDVLDALREEVSAVGDRVDRLLVKEVEDHREVVDAERPEGVLVRAHDAEVLPVAVDAEHLAELADVDELLQLLDTRVVEQQVAGHEDELPVGGKRDELVHLRGPHRRRLLDEDVLARLERLPRELVVRRGRRRDEDGVECGIGEHLLEVRGRARVRVA